MGGLKLKRRYVRKTNRMRDKDNVPFSNPLTDRKTDRDMRSLFLLTDRHYLFPNEGHPVFDAIHTIRNGSKVIFSQRLLVRVERAVVRSRQLKIPAGETERKGNEN